MYLHYYIKTYFFESKNRTVFFNILKSLFNIWLNRRQLDFCIFSFAFCLLQLIFWLTYIKNADSQRYVV